MQRVSGKVDNHGKRWALPPLDTCDCEDWVTPTSEACSAERTGEKRRWYRAGILDFASPKALPTSGSTLDSQHPFPGFSGSCILYNYTCLKSFSHTPFHPQPRSVIDLGPCQISGLAVSSSCLTLAAVHLLFVACTCTVRP